MKLLSAFQQNVENFVATIEKAEQDIIIKNNNNKINITRQKTVLFEREQMSFIDFVAYKYLLVPLEKHFIFFLTLAAGCKMVERIEN